MASKFFNISLFLLVISIPFPGYSFTSFFLILLSFFWLFINDFKEKQRQLAQNFKYFIVLSLPFWISLFGLLNTSAFEAGLVSVQEKLSFLVLPLIFMSIKCNKTYFYEMHKYFSYALLIAAFAVLIMATYLYLMNYGSYFYYDGLATISQKHTTYFSLFCIISLIFLLNHRIYFPLKIFSAFLIFLFIYLLSVRISIVAIAMVVIYQIKNFFSNKLWRTITGVICVSVVFLILLTPNFQKRFNSTTPEGMAISDIEMRKIHWKSVWGVIKDNFVIGVGTGDSQSKFIEQYKMLGLDIGIKEKYNAHNQFLEFFAKHGLLGFMAFLLMLYYLLFKIGYENHVYLILCLVCCCFMMTESILERQSGIMIFSIFSVLATHDVILRKRVALDKKD